MASLWYSAEVADDAASTVDKTDVAFKCAAALLCMFAIRDALTGMLRYLLQLAHLSPLWFVPDLLAMIAFAYFVWHYAIQKRSAFAIVATLSTISAAAVSIIFMSWTPAMFASSVKSFMPIFVGFICCGRSVVRLPSVRVCLAIMSAVSIIGLIFAPHIDYPWVGADIDSFNGLRNISRVWWIDGKVRYGGFAGDSTMAAFMVLFPYMMVYRWVPKWMNLLILPLMLWAIQISTNRTALLTLVMFTLHLVVVDVLIPAKNRLDVDRLLAKLSFLTVLVPFILVFTLAGMDLKEVSSSLMSLQDRIDNSWQLPFTYLQQIFPAGLLIGCGLGCFAYPMKFSDMAQYNVPVDNFYMTTYLMLGIPFLVIVAGVFVSCFKTMDRTKLLLLMMLNVYAITVQCYGPAFATLMMGYAFSDAFVTDTGGWRRRFRKPVGSDGKVLATS